MTAIETQKRADEKLSQIKVIEEEKEKLNQMNETLRMENEKMKKEIEEKMNLIQQQL